MKILGKELKEWYYSDDWEEGCYVEAQDGIFDFESLVENIADDAIVSNLNELIFIVYEEKNTVVNAETHFKKWREKQTTEYIKINKKDKNEILKFIENLNRGKK